MNGTDPNLPLWLAFLGLSELVSLDHLTGLRNRRYFEETLVDHLAAARRYSRPLSLLLFDIDNFKVFNDTLGHDAGDAMLRQFAELLKASTRSADIACRYGGDEFAVILPETGRTEAGTLAERIDRALTEQNPDLSVTTGIAALPCDNLVASADADLLERKKARRNMRHPA